MVKKGLFVLLMGVTLMLSGCGDQSNNGDTKTKTKQQDAVNIQKEAYKNMTEEHYPQFEAVTEDEKVVVIHTSMGDIKAKLFPKYAPKAVENFLTHSENGYYDGIIFHRVIKDFMVQTGDPRGNGTGGESIWGGSFEDEFTPALANFRGALSMANSGPNTNGSQFFIVQKSDVEKDLIAQMKEVGFPEKTIQLYEEKGGTPWLDFRHTVFGQVVEGMDVVDAIAGVKTGAQDKPAEDIVIKSIEVIQ